jgi:hypothetical protein
MAAAAGVSYSSVQRIWHAHGPKPHLVKTFKASRHKNFATKVEDVVGLNLNPPDKAVILCVNEKTSAAVNGARRARMPLRNEGTKVVGS